MDEIVTIDPPQGADTNWQPLRVRLLRIDGRDGPAFYATSLTDSDVSIEDIAYLYHLRWESEEFFKLFTSNYAGQGQFRSRTPSGVRQEIGALTLLLAMSRMLRTLDRRRPGRSYPRRSLRPRPKWGPKGHVGA